jgi:hypothetical protein
VCLFAQSHDPDEASLSSAKPRIPEPMVFDLVRPLGAKRGELEVNSLFRGTRWAPEVEYTFANGWGLEFELPIDKIHIESTKTAIQGTLPGSIGHRSIHGVQFIWENLVREPGGQTDSLYLFGYRFNKRWSVFHMKGLRRQWSEADSKSAMLSNHTVFYQPNKKLVFGVEANYQGETLDHGHVLVMPQVHFKLGRLNLQTGLGLNQSVERRRAQFALRLSREF